MAKQKVDKIKEEPLSYDDWYAENEEAIYMELDDSGATRELCFNSEREFELRYEKYLEYFEKSRPNAHQKRCCLESCCR